MQNTTRETSARKRLSLAVALAVMLAGARSQALQISEVMYHPPSAETQNEWLELYNETSARVDLSGWAFAEGIDYVFPAGTTLDPGAYLVVAIDPATVSANYGISNVVGPFTGRLANGSDHVILYDPAGGIMAEVDYEDRGNWPAAADDTGHSLAKFRMRGDPMDGDNWRASLTPGGTPGRPNGFEPWVENTVLIGNNEVWRYFKGVSEASNPVTAWRQIGFDDSAWLQGATGIGYDDGDDTTILGDMRFNYWSVFCRKTFTIADPADIDSLFLEIDHDDGFIAYLNGTQVASDSMPNGSAYNAPAASHGATVDGGALTIRDITAFKGLLVAGTNVLAVQVHNTTLDSSDLTFIPRLINQTTHQPGATQFPVVLNEVRFNTSGTQYIELYNQSTSPVDVGYFYLSNDPNNLQLFRIPTPTVIPGNGHVAFLQPQLGFTILSAGEQILFTSGTGNVVLDARVVEAGPFERTEGRWPDGAGDWFYMEPTTGTANSVVLESDVVINELMYHPISDLDTEEYLELYNRGASTISLAGWGFTRGINFDFPATATIAAGQYIVVAKDRASIIAKYGLDPAIVYGNYGGTLSNGGEKVRLRDADYNVADEIRYYEGGNWPGDPDGYGPSLELIDPRQDNANPMAWERSDEAAKAQWTFFTYSGQVATQADSNEHEIHLHLLGDGEVFIDDLRLYSGGTDYIPNDGFEPGVAGWTFLGNHMQTARTNEDAHGGAWSLKMVSTGSGDTGANHIERDSITPMPNNQTYTISFWAKWVKGNNLVVARCYNNQMAETHRVPVPGDNGTPGAQNSVFQANQGPVFSAIRHSPVVPGPADTPVLRTMISDADGVTSATAYYRPDSSGAFATVTMHDDGTGGDSTAGDGVFAAQIPAQPAGQTVAFYLKAEDGAGAVNYWPADITRPAHYRVENGLFVSSFPTYRIIMTAAEQARLFNTLHKSNEPINCTFIFNEEDIYYNCGVRFTGSPYGRGGNNYRGFKVSFKDDERLHGVKWMARVDSGSLSAGQNGGYRDRLSYDLLQIMRVPTCPTEWFAVRLNDRNEGVMEDTLPPGKRYLDMFFRGDDDQNLMEVSNLYGFTDNDDANPQNFFRRDTTFEDWGDDKDDYRWWFRLRNNQTEDDFTTLIAMVKTLANSPDATYQEDVASVIDVEQWMRVMAVRSVNNDWDFFGTEQSKNAYMYWPKTLKRWVLLPWDCELTYEAWGWRYDSGLYCYGPAQNVIRRFQQFGGNHHYFLNAMHEYYTKFFTHAHMDPLIDHYYSVIGGVSPGTIKNFIDARRNQHVTPLLNQYLPPSPGTGISITETGPIVVTTPMVTLHGTAPVNATYARVNGVDYKLDWTSANDWVGTFQVLAGLNDVVLTFLDYDKQLIGSASIQINAQIPLDVEGWKRY